MLWNPLPGIVENLIAEGILAALAGGGALAWLKRRSSPWFLPLCWGIGGAAVIAIGVASLKIAATLSRPADEVNAENIEGRLREWLDKFGFSTKTTENAAAFFSYEATSPNGVSKYAVYRPKTRFEQYVIIAGTLRFDSPEIKALNNAEADRLMRTLRIKMAEMKIASSIALPLNAITVTSNMPISKQLTEDAFIAKMDDLDYAERVLAETARLAAESKH